MYSKKKNVERQSPETNEKENIKLRLLYRVREKPLATQDIKT